jgi:phage terminase large subunit-like protein
MRREDSAWFTNGFTRAWWAAAEDHERRTFLESLSEYELESFFNDWRIWARDKQLAPEGIWTTWLLLAGRGFGKTRTSVEFVKDEVAQARSGRIAIVGQGESDIREVLIEGPSGFLATALSDFRPVYQPSVGSGRLVWPNGAIGYTYSAADPESLRGPEFDLGIFDEPMAVPAEARQKTVSNLKFGLRRSVGARPRMVYTTTPRPHRWLTDELAKAAKYEHLPTEKRRYVTTRGSTLENRSNLPSSFFESIMDDYDGTSLGRQEIYAEILGTEEGALWTPELLNACRMVCPETVDGEWPTQLLVAFANSCERVIVSVDPNMSSASKTAHAAGIMVMGLRDRKVYIIADRTVRGGPAVWAAAVNRAVEDFDADEVVAEINQGGDMVKMVLRAHGVSANVHTVRASRGKQRRAEPVATCYERGDVIHLQPVGSTDKPGPFLRLETQMCALHDAFDPTGEDFDRCDALVWGVTRLAVRRLHRLGSTGRMGIMTMDSLSHG